VTIPAPHLLHDKRLQACHWLLMCTWTLLQVMDALMADPRLGRNLSAPSISAGRDNLYMRGKYAGLFETCDNFMKLAPACWTPAARLTPQSAALQPCNPASCTCEANSCLQLGHARVCR
jgi:hypothetical protein